MNAPYTLQRHKLSIADYHRMGEAGIFPENTRVELIEGELIDMSPIGSAHASIVDSMISLLVRRTDHQSVRVSSQNPISLPPDSEPQPDIVLLKPRADRYSDALPTATAVLLLIEVADSSIGYDRGAKLPLYARHEIPEVWIVDIQRELLEVYRDPAGGRYQSAVQAVKSDALTPLLVPTLQIRVAEVFP